MTPRIICPIQRGSARAAVALRCDERVKVYGIKPLTFIRKIQKKSVRAGIRTDLPAVAPQAALNSAFTLASILNIRVWNWENRRGAARATSVRGRKNIQFRLK